MLNFSEACERNQEPIRQTMSEWIDTPGLMLELGSGSGQHALYLGAAFPQLRWQPTETSLLLPVLQQNLSQRPVNVLAPLMLDVTESPWPVVEANQIFTANTLHIIGWNAVEALLLGAGRCLTSGGLLFVYGPMRYQGQYTSASNAEFDRWLQQRDPASGIREFEQVDGILKRAGMALLADHSLPANNQLLVWRKD
ncbi:DUF938 domain-containing protein [Motiliproteus sediminis]|uniref:DUF938 domain-containing protein n=1 Tax=Motiliproteus sediminis TaxID=1468178 RepID=UPI001FE98465|nr:DUF938 domain-containing protein [Motiliproteus sediminis]